MKQVESDIQLEMKKGENKNFDILKYLAKQKKETKALLDGLPIGTLKSSEDLLSECDNLITNLEEALIDALADDSANFVTIDRLIKEVSILKEKVTC